MTKDQAAEVERLESEARAKAAKHVANMLARPDQLEKVHQLTWRVSRCGGRTDVRRKYF